MVTTAGDVMTRGATCIEAEDTLRHAARLMRDHGIGALPIRSADGSLIGMVTDRDIVLRCLANGEDPDEVTAGSLATGELQTVDAEDPIVDVLSIMRRHQIRRLPVMGDGNPVGMISMSDLVAALPPDEIADLTQAVFRQD